MRCIFLHTGASTAGLLVTTLFHLEHRQQWRVFHVIIHPAVVMTTTVNSCNRQQATRLEREHYAGDTRSRNLHKKFSWKIGCKFVTVSCKTTTGWPITLHRSSHVPQSFSRGIEQCSTACKKHKQEKTCTRLTDTCARQLAQVSDTRFPSVCCRQQTDSTAKNRN